MVEREKLVKWLELWWGPEKDPPPLPGKPAQETRPFDRSRQTNAGSAAAAEARLRRCQ